MPEENGVFNVFLFQITIGDLTQFMSATTASYVSKCKLHDQHRIMLCHKEGKSSDFYSLLVKLENGIERTTKDQLRKK